jgi:hypothetical protein
MADTGRAPKDKLRDAVDLALGGDWQKAHLIVEDYEDDPTAAWIHAVVHRMEGDLANAGYWYRRCRRALREQVSTEDELREIAAELMADPAADR